ncbi:hypothetical protein SORBI_3009G008701, partial [Sorghum bicolor]
SFPPRVGNPQSGVNKYCSSSRPRLDRLDDTLANTRAETKTKRERSDQSNTYATSSIQKTKTNMANAIRGVFISCDAPMAEFVAMLNESMPESERFILYRLDDTHMYVLPQAAAMIRREITEFSKRNFNNNLRTRQQRKITVKSNLKEA